MFESVPSLLASSMVRKPAAHNRGRTRSRLEWTNVSCPFVTRRTSGPSKATQVERLKLWAH
eukprot:scaffold116292_cov29-Tisochrysis_lutea.AAC.7